MLKTNWNIKEVDLAKADKISKEFSLPSPIAAIMSQRELSSKEKTSTFFYPKKGNLHDPFLLMDMDIAIKKIIDIINNKEKILIYGDYDVDGVTSTSILYNFFKSLKVNISYYIPHRDIDGYGLSKRGIDFADSIGAKLIITCDCGINAFEEIQYAKDKMIETIITDHHKPEDKIPDCVAIVNPNRIDCSYPFKGLCGAGVAFKLGLGIVEKLSLDPEIIWKYADLVTLGIAADIMPIIDENRVIAHFGLEQIRKGNNLGLKTLIQSSKLVLEKVGIGQINFWISPKINAAGRLGEASRAVKLLTSTNPYYALEISNTLNKENERRKAITASMESESIEILESQLELKKEKAVVLYKNGWHPGVIGIVASRIKELYNKPTIIIGVEEGIGKGSCRSISKLDMVSALDSCSDLLDGYGGHPMAAGLTIKESNLSEFVKRFNLNCASALEDKDLVPRIIIDLEISINDINTRMINFLKHMEPYGPKNPKPLFLSKGLHVDGIPKLLGKDQTTIKFSVRQKDSIFEAIGFRMLDEYEKLISQRPIDIVYGISENYWNGKTSLQLEIKGIRYSDV
mgnify:CR=1 FL=1